jgi:serralysin
VPNAFLRSGSGTDGLNVSLVNGNNILDGGTGSNFLTGGTGSDTFYMDDRDPASPVFSTVVNFHSGDNVTVWGIDPLDFAILKLDIQGVSGFTGLDLIFAASNHIDVSFVLVGYTTADLTNGRRTSSYGTTGEPSCATWQPIFHHPCHLSPLAIKAARMASAKS